MELPKHTTQVGTIPANKKLYLEDYCISYRKQLDDTYPGERKQIALFGTIEKEKNIEYVFAYGAALLGRGKGRTDSLTAVQKEEAEQYRQTYFPDYKLVGLIIESDSVNEAFYWIGNGTKAIAIDGYYIFYDQNEVMLNFMMENQNEERDIDMDPVIAKKASMDREKKERKEKEEREKIEARQNMGTYRKRLQSAGQALEKQKGKNNAFPVAAAIVLVAIISVYGIRTYYPNITFSNVKTTISEWIGKASVQTSNYLASGSSELLLAENDAVLETDESQGEREIPVATQTPPAPADMDVVVIPDLDVLKESTASSEGVTPVETVTDTETTTSPEGVVQEMPIQQTEQNDEMTNQEAAPAEPVEYLIKRGDNLLRILRTHYGDESKLQEICVVNNIKDPNNIQVGQIILLP